MLPSHNDLLGTLYDLSPDRRAATRYLDSLRNQFEAPEKDLLVGSKGPDWSFRLSKIQNDEFGRRGNFPTYKLLRELIQPNVVRHKRNGKDYIPRMRYAGHGMLDVVGTSKTGIIKWSQWAKANDVRHDGRWGYIFPRKRVWNTDPATFGSLHTVCARLTGSRSDSARRRRADRRKLLAKVHDFKAVETPVVWRLERSQTSIRKTWFSLGPKRPRWCDFKNHTSNRLIRCIGPVRSHRSEIPELVELSLLRIYSRVIYEPILKHKVLQGPPLEVKTVPSGYSRAELVRLLRSIEDRGFHETYSWFYLNHLLYEKTS